MHDIHPLACRRSAETSRAVHAGLSPGPIKSDFIYIARRARSRVDVHQSARLEIRGAFGEPIETSYVESHLPASAERVMPTDGGVPGTT